MRHHLGKKAGSIGSAVGVVIAAIPLTAAAQNLLINPGFESPTDTSGSSTDSTASGWNFYGGDVLRANYQNHTPGGEWMIWEQTFNQTPVPPATPGSGVNQLVPVPLTGVGTTYTLSCWYYFEANEPTVTGEVSDLALTFLNASFATVGTPDANGYSDATYIPSSSVTMTGSWVQYTVTGVAPTGTTQVAVSFDFTTTATISGGSLGAFVDDADLTGIGNVPSSAEWALTGSGDYNAAGNWTTGSVPNAVGAEADFFGPPPAVIGISAPSTIYTNTAVTAGILHFNNPNEYLISGVGSLTLSSATGAKVLVDQGTDELDLPVTLASNTTFTVAAGATLIIANPLTIDAGKALTQTGAGTVTYQSTISLGTGASIAFGDSTHAHQLSLASTATASIGGTGTTLQLDSLSNGGTLDVQTNTLLIDYANPVDGTADPAASIRAQLISGYASGHWNGVGIDSSAIGSNTHYGVGYADSADPGNPAGLAPGTLEVKYTLNGDANLDGVVNGTDFGILAANFGQQAAAWDKGDFNYDGVVNGSDFGALAANFGQESNGGAVELPASDYAALDAFASANGLLADVPEPASLGLLTLGMVGALARRRHRSKA